MTHPEPALAVPLDLPVVVCGFRVGQPFHDAPGRGKPYHAEVLHGSQKASVRQRKHLDGTTDPFGKRAPLLRIAAQAEEVGLGHRHQAALGGAEHLRGGLIAEILGKPAIPVRIRDPLHQAAALDGSPQMAPWILEAGGHVEKSVGLAIAKDAGWSGALDGVTKEPDLAVPA